MSRGPEPFRPAPRSPVPRPHSLTPPPSSRHTSFKRHLPRQMHVSSVDYGNELPPAAEQPTSLGRGRWRVKDVCLEEGGGVRE